MELPDEVALTIPGHVETLSPGSSTRLEAGWLSAINAAITGMPKSGGGTNTAAAIQTAQGGLASGRSAAPNVMIVLTDGQSNDPDETIAAAEAAKQAGTTMIAVGIGAGPDNAELRGMASSIGLVFTPGTFEDLIFVLEALVPTSGEPIP